MSAKPRLLIVTPTLGRSAWLDRTVASVTAHAGEHVRHVLVAPPDRLDDLRSRFPHCTLVADSVARGVYPAINLGLTQNGLPDWQWFTWINDDDELAPGFAAHAEQALSHDTARLDTPWYYGLVQLRDGNDGPLGGLAVAREPADIIALVQSGISPLNQQGMLAPRVWVDLLGSIREDLKICADLDFWLRAVAAGADFRCTAETVAVFRLRAGQISGDVARHQQEFKDVVNRLVPTPLSAARRLAARTRFRLGNAGTYLERVKRSGWKGGFELLQQPARKNS